MNRSQLAHGITAWLASDKMWSCNSGEFLPSCAWAWEGKVSGVIIRPVPSSFSFVCPSWWLVNATAMTSFYPPCPSHLMSVSIMISSSLEFTPLSIKYIRMCFPGVHAVPSVTQWSLITNTAMLAAASRSPSWIQSSSEPRLADSSTFGYAEAFCFTLRMYWVLTMMRAHSLFYSLLHLSCFPLATFLQGFSKMSFHLVCQDIQIWAQRPTKTKLERRPSVLLFFTDTLLKERGVIAEGPRTRLPTFRKFTDTGSKNGGLVFVLFCFKCCPWNQYIPLPIIVFFLRKNYPCVKSLNMI